MKHQDKRAIQVCDVCEATSERRQQHNGTERETGIWDMADISWEYHCSLCTLSVSLLSRCGQRRLLLLEQEEPQVGKKKRRRIRQVSRYHKKYVQVSRPWWAVGQNPLPASSSTPSCKPSRACLPRSPSTGSRRLTPVLPLSPLPLLKLLPQPPPS